jgi:hypothetical protein
LVVEPPKFRNLQKNGSGQGKSYYAMINLLLFEKNNNRYFSKVINYIFPVFTVYFVEGSWIDTSAKPILFLAKK